MPTCTRVADHREEVDEEARGHHLSQQRFPDAMLGRQALEGRALGVVVVVHVHVRMVVAAMRPGTPSGRPWRAPPRPRRATIGPGRPIRRGIAGDEPEEEEESASAFQNGSPSKSKKTSPGSGAGSSSRPRPQVGSSPLSIGRNGGAIVGGVPRLDLEPPGSRVARGALGGWRPPVRCRPPGRPVS